MELYLHDLDFLACKPFLQVFFCTTLVIVAERSRRCFSLLSNSSQNNAICIQNTCTHTPHCTHSRPLIIMSSLKITHSQSLVYTLTHTHTHTSKENMSRICLLEMVLLMCLKATPIHMVCRSLYRPHPYT